MCLSIPVRIVSIEGKMAEVSAGGTLFKAGLHMLEDARVGDYVLTPCRLCNTEDQQKRC